MMERVMVAQQQSLLRPHIAAVGAMLQIAFVRGVELLSFNRSIPCTAEVLFWSLDQQKKVVVLADD